MPRLLLRTDVASLGRIGDLVDVKEGYARNYLIPKGLAVEPTPANVKRIEEEKKKIEARRAQELAEKKAMAAKLEGVEVTIVGRANEQGVLFGSVGPKEIADALSEDGYNVDESHVVLPEHLKQVDKHAVKLRFAEEVEATIAVWIAPEKTLEGAAPGPETEGPPTEGSVPDQGWPAEGEPPETNDDQ